ncbi:bifunctional 3,4-dihydroxy-2-butanone-4-phosphate synthase/GTP cyclohydrolase II [Klugiella xanthotipulae]|uniref:Multifunctional fusion protein n=1 Tax=Klugiella xanthotipulae TaxID=244735 RepID=A0A543HYY0_9MICO|nr:3,4-dihydroxy-2-butanone-4-phosphate synthase [Klugiella xanthotipulae]TQM63465.1 3,4-dihydroxy 2-butanone 4-phosphate synthase/GTP cyclohydrolase II [Klugiella xanthotipulae]
MALSTITDAIEALRAGRPVIVADNEDRENEGDVVLSAELATPEWIAWTVRHSSGFICAPMTNEIADRLDLPVMVAHNEDDRGTAYTVTVDAANRISTGISATDRAHTLRVLADPESVPTSVNRPGHVVPLRAVDGGVRERDGHTEASVELMQLAGLTPVAAICEIVEDNGEMMRLPHLLLLGERDNIPVITIEQLIAHLRERDGETEAPAERATHRRVSLKAETTVPTSHGTMWMRAYRDRSTGIDHLAVLSGDNIGNGTTVRIHSECLTGEAFGSLKCECGPQLDAALDYIAEHGGAVIYMRGQEGRGIGLANKLRAYQLQEAGLDTLDANLALGLPIDSRDYGAAADILRDLGISSIRLLSNNPDKAQQLEAHGVTITELVPLVVGTGADNDGYLQVKRDRMGHQLPAGSLIGADRAIADAPAPPTHNTAGDQAPQTGAQV